MSNDKKPIIWMGSSLKDLIAMPDGVRKDFGGALHGIQEGRTPDTAKVLKGKAKGAVQLSEDHDGETYRTVYTIELEGSSMCCTASRRSRKAGSQHRRPIST